MFGSWFVHDTVCRLALGACVDKGGYNGSTENENWVEGTRIGDSNVKHQSNTAHLLVVILLLQADHSSSSKAAVPKM